MMTDQRGWRIDGVMGDIYRVPRKYPRRQAVRWGAQEDQDLLRQFQAGAHVDDIAAFHERSVGAIGWRLVAIGAIPSQTEYLHRIAYYGHD